MRVLQQAQILRSVGGQHVDSIGREDGANNAASERERKGLGQRLADDPRSSGAERNSCRKLIGAAGHPREHHICDARTRRQQQQPGRGENEQQAQPDLACENLADRSERH